MDDLKDQLQRHEGLLENLTISIGKRRYTLALVFYTENILNLGTTAFKSLHSSLARYHAHT